MILPERVLGRPGANWMTSGEAIGPISLRTQATSSLRRSSVGSTPVHHRDIGVDALALDVVRIADDGGFRDGRVGDQRAFDLGGAHAMAGHVDDVVDAAGDPVIAVGVAAAAVAGEIFARIGREIGLLEALMVAIDRAHLARPGIGDDQIALAGAVDDIARGVDDLRLHAEEGPGRRTGLQGVGAGKRGDQDAAGFGLPPGVDDRAAVVADDAMIPFPGFRIDRLADRAEQAQASCARSS